MIYRCRMVTVIGQCHMIINIQCHMVTFIRQYHMIIVIRQYHMIVMRPYHMIIVMIVVMWSRIRAIWNGKRNIIWICSGAKGRAMGKMYQWLIWSRIQSIWHGKKVDKQWRHKRCNNGTARITVAHVKQHLIYRDWQVSFSMAMQYHSRWNSSITGITMAQNAQQCHKRCNIGTTYATVAHVKEQPIHRLYDRVW